MREILFRGKTKAGRWAYGSLILAGSYCCILESEENAHPSDYPYLDNDLGTIDGTATPVIPETVGQFTGLTDSKDTKIFEGDIVCENWSKVFASKSVHLVRWEDGSCGFEPLSDSIHNCGHCGGALNPDWVEVVGNIYDNSEMLEDKTNEST